MKKHLFVLMACFSIPTLASRVISTMLPGLPHGAGGCTTLGYHLTITNPSSVTQTVTIDLEADGVAGIRPQGGAGAGFFYYVPAHWDCTTSFGNPLMNYFRNCTNKPSTRTLAAGTAHTYFFALSQGWSGTSSICIAGVTSPFTLASSVKIKISIAEDQGHVLGVLQQEERTLPILGGRAF